MDRSNSQNSKQYSRIGDDTNTSTVNNSSRNATASTLPPDNTTIPTLMIPSLVVLCRTVVTNHLERYTPESFHICDIYEWDEIVRLRHAMTQPNKKLTSPVPGNHHHHHHHSHHSNDLDGNGRLLPAISEKVLQPIEECNEHLADSTVADTLVWKDCVEYRFKRNVGLLRPPVLFEPWPLLVQRLQTYGQILSAAASLLVTDHVHETNNTETKNTPSTSTVDINEVIQGLQSTTWNVALLRDTGIGKIVKRVLKKMCTTKTGSSPTATLTEEHYIVLQQLLSGWMQLATTNNTTGIYQWKATTTTTTITTTSSSTTSITPSVEDVNHTTTMTTAKDDLQLLEKCLSWRQLYVALEQRKVTIQATQGKRMREIRNNVRVYTIPLSLFRSLLSP